MEGPRADSEEKREPVSDIDIAVVDSLKVLDPNRPIREANSCTAAKYVSICDWNCERMGFAIGEREITQN